MKPSINIIVPAFNGSRFLGMTLESVLSQTLGDFELILVDDGSTDSTRQMAQAYAARDARVRVISQENRGVAAARNRGLAESDSRAPYVLFLDQDDLLEPDALARLVDAAEADPASVGAHGRIAVIGAGSERPEEADEFERIARERPIVTTDGLIGALPPDAPTTLESAAVYNPLRTPGVALLKRSALETAGGFDAATEPADDWDLWLRLTRIGHLTFVDAVTLRYRLHGANASKIQARQMLAAERRVRRKALADPAYAQAQRVALLRGHQALYRQQARAKWTYARECLRDRDVRGATLEAMRAARRAYNAATGLP
jgi:glycosyltransferase involved in cell wall biosynthesis